jgi:putative hemolysin
VLAADNVEGGVMMKQFLKIAVITGALALAAAPAFAANPHEGEPPYGHGPTYNPAEPPTNPTPGPKAGLPAQAKAYGRYCKEQGASKKHVKGEQGTEFSRCVKAMAKAANEEKTNPSKACKGMSRKHVKGEKGTEFSRCVKAAKHLRKDQEAGAV